MTDSLPMLLAILVAGTAVVILGVVLWRARQPAHPHAAAMAELTRAHSDTAARLEAMIGMLAKGQTHLAHTVNERLDSVSHRLGDSLEKTKQNTTENLQKLNERLAVIDSAQKNITALATQVTSLQSVLANKQSRGAFGQGRMEVIVRDGLPRDCYAFQYTLSNRLRPDCAIFMPDKRPLVVDSKFPLEAVTAYRDAKSDDERKLAAARVRQDVIKHVGDIAQKYLIPGETQDMAFMFVPSESVYAELHEDFDDVVQKAFRAKIVIVSPSLLMLAIQLVRQNQKDARMREAADQIRDEVGRLMKDVGLLGERIRKLQTHFTQANEDVRLSVVSIEKIETRGERITQVELQSDLQGELQGELNGTTVPAASNVIAAPMARKLEAGE
ncbi:MAG TPA: DNA recombination protein RmuC [Xanthobacteraceae bacterium]|jgi:DNA recombination protein RmuC|nr:DNA recombination protein RmuC [Xanthobacteraceae bacterium]